VGRNTNALDGCDVNTTNKYTNKRQQCALKLDTGSSRIELNVIGLGWDCIVTTDDSPRVVLFASRQVSGEVYWNFAAWRRVKILLAM
jgi:hypothetical protein